MNTDGHSDAELVSRSLAGDREAFGGIVSRYQTLICSLAYSRIGNLGQSEDVAQETFLTAWKHLGLLREPDKLRAWLCGIVRNRIHKNLRREGREPARDAEPLEQLQHSPAADALPSDHAASREEEAILWRSLEKIPEIYREPLVLFYREHQSIATVAVELDLTEDAVKQRLSRGRKLLQDEVQAVVENTLRRTAPDRAFSGAVLAALPVVPEATAGAGLAGKSMAAAKSGLSASLLAPLIGIIGGILAHWLIVRAAPTARERRLKQSTFIGIWIFVLTWSIPGPMGMRVLSRHLVWSDATYFRMMAGFWWVYAMVLATLGVVMFRRVTTIRRECGDTPRTPAVAGRKLNVGAGIALVSGVHLAYFSWLIALAWQAHDRTSASLLTAIMVTLASWNLVGFRNKTGTAQRRMIAGHQALIWGIILLVLICCLQEWVASLNHIDLAEMRRLLPEWLITTLATTVAVWVWLLLTVSTPGRIQLLPAGPEVLSTTPATESGPLKPLAKTETQPKSEVFRPGRRCGDEDCNHTRGESGR